MSALDFVNHLPRISKYRLHCKLDADPADCSILVMRPSLNTYLAASFLCRILIPAH